MNRYHRRRCRSRGWSDFMAGTVLPHALDGIDLGPRVLELGPGYGASTKPLAARVRSLTVLEYDPLLAARLRCFPAPASGPARLLPAHPTILARTLRCLQQILTQYETLLFHNEQRPGYPACRAVDKEGGEP